ncbi:MAG: ACP S-malonyltransferase [Bacillota bacterium]|nr:ACP S-malonyltransferase [Bacillota bacterium]
MALAFVFPGQGSQYVGMGRRLAGQDPEAAGLYAEADEVLGFPLTRLMREGPEEELRRTVNTQPALVTVSTAVARRLMRDIRPDYVAGHSLGEYSALVAAGALGFPEVLQLVRRRAEAMEAAVPGGRGGMAAVLGLGTEAVREAVASAAATGGAGAGVVEIANYNCPGQVVLSGETGALRQAGEECLRRGATKVVELEVSGPFHSSLMRPAAEALAAALAGVTLKDAAVPVVANYTAALEQEAGEIRSNLIRQLTGAVRWEESIRLLIDLGVDVFVEVGPGKVLSGLIKRIDRRVAVLQAEEPEGCQKVLDFLGGGG